jgi:adenine-specific DNA-methyltransferase
MAHIDTLIDKVADPALRQMLRDQVDSMLTKQSFGLVFQSHKPETVELSNYRVRRGCKVRIPAEGDGLLYLVDRVTNGTATVVSIDEKASRWDIPAEDLVVVREFGEPIYPGLHSIGRVVRGGEKPAHIVINAENFHALETLLYTHEGKIDAIYIDPPYNSGARDWKYNNDYIDGVDQYRHSKWLAMMKRRLDIAKRLLNTDNSVLLVTIDEKECVRLGMLLEQVFEGEKVQMITTVISAKGTMRRREFSRVAEHIFVVLIGEAAVIPWGPNMLNEGITEEPGEPVEWLQLRRREPSSTRPTRKGQFYPIFVNLADGSLHSIGDAIAPDVDRHKVPVPTGAIAIWPMNRSGKEMVWGLTAPVLRQRGADGHFRLRNWKPQKETVSVQYLPGGVVEGLASGRIHVVGRDPDGAVQAMYGEDVRGAIPKTVWNVESHNAESYGTNLLSKLIPGRRFDYPKSLHAVEDTLRFFVGDKPDATILDFFGGSGTTTHAVARLNQLDDGRRQCILITNNEVSEDEAKVLRADGFFPGDDEWEALGICNYITIPRIEAAFTGKTPEGEALTEPYKFNGEYAMVDGLDENVEFFELSYEDPDLVSLGRKFSAVAPLLWLKAGGRGTRVDEAEGSWSVPVSAAYGVLFDVDDWRGFVEAVRARPDVTHAFVVTDSEAAFQQIASELPTNVTSTQLYSDYLHSFEINTQSRA